MAYGRSRLGEGLDDILASSAFQEQVSRFHVWLGQLAEKMDTICPSFEEWLEYIAADKGENTF